MYSENELARQTKEKLRDNVAVGNATGSANVGSQVWVNVNGRNIRGIARNSITPGQSVAVFQDASGVNIVHANENELTDEFLVRERRHRDRLIEEEVTAKGLIVFKERSTARGAIVFQDSTPIFGNLGILFHKIHRREGNHPEELCPCDRSVAYTYSNGTPQCTEGCGGGGEFYTLEECENEINRRLEPSPKYFYHSTYIDSPNNNYKAYIPPSTAKRLNYELADDGNMYIVEPKIPINGKIKGYSYTYQKFFYINEQLNVIYLEWWEVELHYAGVQLLYFDINNNTITKEYGWINTIREPFPMPVSFPVGIDADGQIIGTVFQGSFAKHYTKPRFSETDPPVPPPPPIGTVWDDFTVPYFIYWGEIESWLQEIILPPSFPGATPGTTPVSDISANDREGNHYVISYYLGACVSPAIKLGEYLYSFGNGNYLFEEKPFNSDVPGGTDTPEEGAFIVHPLSEGFISTIGEGQYEIVISYGISKKLKTFYGGNNSRQEIYALYWCAKDVYRFGRGYGNYKRTYKFPEDVEIHEKNWMGNFLKSWSIADYEESDIYPYYKNSPTSRQAMKDYDSGLRPEYFYNINIPEQAYYLGITTNRKENYNYLAIPSYANIEQGSQFIQKIYGADAGYINAYPYSTGGIGVNFAEKESNSNDIYGTDIDGHQFVQVGEEKGEFVDMIKNHDIENIPIKGGQIELGFYEKRVRNPNNPNSLDGIYPSFSTLGYIINLVFNEQRSGTVQINKCFSLGHEICRIKQMVAYVPLEDLKQVSQPMYGYVIKSPLCWDYGDFSENLEDITFSTKHTYKNLYKFFTIIPYYNTDYGDYNEESYTIPKNNLSTSEDFTKNVVNITKGWITLNQYATWRYYTSSLNQTQSALFFPLIFKNCDNATVKSYNWQNGIAGLIVSLGSSRPERDPQFVTQSLWMGGQIIDICTKD